MQIIISLEVLLIYQKVSSGSCSIVQLLNGHRPGQPCQICSDEVVGILIQVTEFNGVVRSAVPAM